MKTSAIIRLVIWLLVAAVLISLLVAGLTGGFSGWPGFGGNDFFSSVFGGVFRYGSYDDSDYTVASSAEIDAEGIRNISIDWIGGDVKIAAHGGSSIEFEENSGTALEPSEQMRYLVDGNTLRIRFARPGLSFFGQRRPFRKSLTVKVPENLELSDLDVGTVSAECAVTGLRAEDCVVDTVSGDVVIDSSVTGSLSLDTVSGRISVKNSSGGTADTDTTSGRVELRGADFKEIDIDTVSGSVEAEGAFDRFTADTVSGSVKAESSVMPSRVDFDTVSGSATLTIPENSGFRASWSRVSGGFDCDFDADISKNSAVYKDGSAEIHFDTISGNMYIKKS